MTDPLLTSLEQAGEGSLADLIDRLTLYEHREGYDGKDWEKIASEAAEAIRALHADKAMLTGQLQASRAMLAASTPVGGWGPVAWRWRFVTSTDGKEWSDWHYRDADEEVPEAPHRIIEPLYAAPPPPSVSTDSRPQEAVPTEQAAPPVLSVEDLLRFAASGAAWNMIKYGAERDANDGRETALSSNYLSVASCGFGAVLRYAEDGLDPFAPCPAPQPADGCSSNEGAGK